MPIVVEAVDEGDFLEWLVPKKLIFKKIPVPVPVVPSLGVKLEACPGILNQFAQWIKISGLYYGQ
jgi:heme/copper-type cytochrome/quinol oxidase subunit 2